MPAAAANDSDVCWSGARARQLATTIEVRDAGHRGLGLFAQVDIAPGFELYYIGQVTSTLSGTHADSEYVMEMMPGSAGQSPLSIHRRPALHLLCTIHQPLPGERPR